MPTLSPKAIALIVLLAALGLFGLYVLNKDKKIEKLTQDNAKQGVVIEVQKDTIVKDAKSDLVNEATNLAVVTKTVVVRKKHEQVIETTQGRVEGIKQEFDAKPKTEENALERANRLSAAHIDGLWTLYCGHLPQAQGCASGGGA